MLSDSEKRTYWFFFFYFQSQYFVGPFYIYFQSIWCGDLIITNLNDNPTGRVQKLLVFPGMSACGGDVLNLEKLLRRDPPFLKN